MTTALPPSARLSLGGWSSVHDRGHPLVGRIFSSLTGRFVSTDELLEQLAGARFVALGERHDNPDHHRVQAWLLRALLAMRPGLSVGFEMLDEDRQPILDALPDRSPSALAHAVSWAESGWPDFSLYEPVFRAVLGGRGRVLAVHPARAALHALHGRALDDSERRHLRLDPPLPPALRAQVAKDLRSGHCNTLGDRHITLMAAVQELKDATMAERLVEGAGKDGAALVAGNGHVWRQTGVPRFLVRRGPHTVLAVGILEVVPGATSPADYEASRYDLLVFTPRVDDEDPCEKFREQLKRLR
jgi:uncharacterized iron-regulated protein